MEIVQSKIMKKIVAVTILMIMLFSIVTPVFAATGKVKLNKSSMTVTVGDTKKIKVSTNTTGEDLYWSGQGKIVGEFLGTSSYLNFKALKEGKQTITAATKDGKVSASCVVTVVAKGGNSGNSNKENSGDENAIGGVISGIGGAVKGIVDSGFIQDILSAIVNILKEIFVGLMNFSFDSSTEAEQATEVIEETSLSGVYKITGYCPCVKCCNKDDGITASGTKAKAGRTIAAPKSFDFGTRVEINGRTYVVEDRGGAITGNKIDMFFNTHEEALQWGVKYLEIKVLD